MSCFSRLLGLICALVPGLILLWFSLNSLQVWPRLGYVVGPFYSLVSFITSVVCLYLGVTILFGRDKTEEPAPPVAPEMPVVATPIAAEPAPLRAAPLPVEMPAEAPASEPADAPASATQSIFSKSDAPFAPPLDTPETRIRRLASTRPGWQVTAPQLAQLANLNMAVADATAREMAARGQAQIQTGPNGETVYVFDLADAQG